MSAERTGENGLAVQYERIRRQEHALITRMLEVLPAIDGLEEERIQQLRDALFHADAPFLMVFVGPFSAGKSSLINALLGRADVLPVGITPTTDRITMLRYSDEPGRARSGDFDTLFYPSKRLQDVALVDTPGLESVFRQHEAQTRRFLHRCDAVFLVMLATQAMTAQTVESLRLLREYGKHVVIVLNQADLLSAEDAEKVRTYVAEQSRAQLVSAPEIWLVSARRGLEACGPDGVKDAEGWAGSGMQQFDAFFAGQLGDAARLRQKLQTPLQIMQSVHQAAQAAVRGGQGALDQVQAISGNIERQLAGFQREDERLLADSQGEIRAYLDEAGRRAEAALRETFAPGRLPRALLSGLSEVVGVRRLLTAEPMFQQALQAHSVAAPLDDVREAADALASKLEGKEMGDVDQLVAYGRRELDGLPATFRSKVIGVMQAPTRYDRAALQEVRPALEAIEGRARVLAGPALQHSVRAANAFFAAYTAVIVLMMLFLVLAQPSSESAPLLWLYLLVGAALLALAGGAGWLLRGRMLGVRVRRQLAEPREQIAEALGKAAARQIAYGMTLRREAVRPLTRLLEAQTTALSEQLNALRTASDEMTAIEAALTRLKA